MTFKPHNSLVTGGAGFIGCNFVRHGLSLPGDGCVVVLDALTYAGNVASLADVAASPRYNFIKGDVCDEALVAHVLEKHEIDTIVHFAAESHVDRSILGPDEFIRTNVLGTHSLLKAARARWLGRFETPHRFHHVSTDEVYGSLGPTEAAFHERTPYAPNSPYSASKAASDHLVRAYYETYGLCTVTTNCSNNYGPFQFPEKLIPLTIINILLGKPIPVYGDGGQVRDWLHVGDHCHAIDKALRYGVSGAVYNIGGDSETANIDIVRMLCEMVDQRMSRDPVLKEMYVAAPCARDANSADLITHVRDRAGHDRRYAIDFSKAARELSYRPSLKLRQGLEATLDWYLGNTAWWRPLLGADYANWIAANYAQKAAIQ